jgi:hypothetical protein
MIVTKNKSPRQIPKDSFLPTWYSPSSEERAGAPPAEEDDQTWRQTPLARKNGDLIQDKDHPSDMGLIVAIDENRTDPYKVYVFNQSGSENRCYWMTWWYVEECCDVISDTSNVKEEMNKEW